MSLPEFRQLIGEIRYPLSVNRGHGHGSVGVGFYRRDARNAEFRWDLVGRILFYDGFLAKPCALAVKI